MRVLRLGPTIDWKRAVAELALIVTGVLIALGVDSWWGDQQDRQRETAYLRQLLSDVREIDARLEETIEGDSALLDRINGTIDAAFAGATPPADSLAIVGGYSQFRPLTGTYAALVQNGDIQLLRDDSLRFEVITYAATISAAQVILGHLESLIWRTMERMLLAQIVHSRSPAPQGREAADRWQRIDVAAALSDPELVSALLTQVLATQNRLNNLRRLKEPTARLIGLLETELGAR
jgi:hypothetical protein